MVTDAEDPLHSHVKSGSPLTVTVPGSAVQEARRFFPAVLIPKAIFVMGFPEVEVIVIEPLAYIRTSFADVLYVGGVCPLFFTAEISNPSADPDISFFTEVFHVTVLQSIVVTVALEREVIPARQRMKSRVFFIIVLFWLVNKNTFNF